MITESWLGDNTITINIKTSEEAVDILIEL